MNKNPLNQRNYTQMNRNNTMQNNNSQDIDKRLEYLYLQQKQLQDQILELKTLSENNKNRNNNININTKKPPSNINMQSLINNKNQKNTIYIDLKASDDLGYLLCNVAFGLAASYKYNMNVSFTNYNKSYDIFKSLKIIESNLINNCININEPNMAYYNKIKLDPSNSYLLSGAFKSYKYLDKYTEKVKKYLFDNMDISIIKQTLADTAQNKKKILLYLPDNDEYINALDTFFINKDKNEYKIFLLSDNNINSEKYDIDRINEENPEKLLILLTLFDHYIIRDDPLALLGYYFRDNSLATISLIPSDNMCINFNDIIPDTKLYIDYLKKLDNAYIINLEARNDNKIRSTREMLKIVNKPEIYKAPNEDNNINISLSHINILKKAIELDLEYVIIAHDNIKILNEMNVLYSINTIMNKCNWNIIIIGGLCIDRKINDIYSRIISAQLPIAYMISKKYYNVLLNNFIEGYNKLLIRPDYPIYLLDEYWKKLQDNEWYSLTNKYIYIQDNYYNSDTTMIDYKDLFKINNINICDYLDYIPIVELFNIQDISDINPIFHNYKYIIVNLLCSKVERTFIKYPIDLLTKNNYDLIHLQKPFIKNAKPLQLNNSDVFNNITSNNSSAYLLNNYLLKKIINNPNYIINNRFNYSVLRTAELKVPIFFDYNDNEWINYYNQLIK